MFSRAILWLCAISLSGGLACSKFLNEKKDQQQALEMKGGNFACLRKFPTQLNQYVDGSIEAQEVRSGLECGKEALKFFNENTRGSLTDAYTPEDLRGFVLKYFVKADSIRPELMIELFKLKKMILGGSDSSLSKGEIHRLTEMIEHLKEPLTVLAPEMPRLLMKAEQASAKEIELSITALTETFLVIVNDAEVLSSKYTFKDLRNLTSELELFMLQNSAEDEAPSKFSKVRDAMPLVESVKNIFIGETAQFRGLPDWQQAARNVTGLHHELLRFHYLFNSKVLDEKQRMQGLIDFVDEAFVLVEQSLPMRQQGSIRFKDLDYLVETLALKKLLPAGLKADSVKVLYKRAILLALDAKRNGDDRGLEAFERSHFAALRQEWRIFKMHQKILEALPFDAQNSIAFSDLKTLAADENNVRRVIDQTSDDTLEKKHLWQAWQDGKAFLLQDFPAMYDREGRALVVSNPQSYRQSFSSLTRWNVVRALSRLMMLGYGKNKGVPFAENIILEESLKAWYADFRDVGVEMKAFDPRSGNSGGRSFKEANFFTFKGDGNQEMSYQETFDFVSMLLSGGMVSAEGIRKGIKERGCELEAMDVFHNPFFAESCYKKNLRSLIPKYFSNLPGLVKQVQALSETEWDEFYKNMLAASRTSNPQDGVIETSDIRTAVMMLHYTESLMVVYDVNANGSLDKGELRRAAPRFREFITQASPDLIQDIADKSFLGLKGSDLVDDIFLYLVYRGHKPGTPLRDYLVTFQIEKFENSLGEVSRDKILRVFKVLKGEAAKK